VKDPNERRALIAIVLCLVVFYVWSAFYGPKPTPAADADGATAPQLAPSAPAEAGSVAAVAQAVPTGPCTERQEQITSSVVELGVSTCGGSVETIRMPGYQEAETVTPWWTWVFQRITGAASGGWEPYSGGEGVLSLLGENGAFGLAGRGAFTTEGAYELVSESPLVLRRVESDGLTITKSLTPTADPDLFDFKVRFESSVPLNGPFWVGLADEFRPPSGAYDMAPHASAVVDGDLEQQLDPQSVTTASTLPGPVSWLGVENRYFLAALAPATPELASWGTFTWAPVGQGHGAFLVGPSTSLAPGAPLELSFKLYAGPKYVERLAIIGHGLDEAANLGFWGFFSKILLFFLGVFHAGLNNWGLSIVALTVFIRLCFYPLSAKAFRSGKAMQEIQPLLKEVQEKYKDDKERQTRETMALFQQHNVNPLGGCLPLLLQMPVFFALYAALLHTPDLFHADFLQVSDLSAPDPYGAFPFFMAVGMVLQQRMTPMTGMDPTQQQMMRLMPLIFALFMFGLPAGLSLYYALNTVLSILQQWYNTRSYQPVQKPA
jgi:YidC/Oxa1 family membrane protein insertase